MIQNIDNMSYDERIQLAYGLSPAESEEHREELAAFYDGLARQDEECPAWPADLDNDSIPYLA